MLHLTEIKLKLWLLYLLILIISYFKVMFLTNLFFVITSLFTVVENTIGAPLDVDF